MTANPPSSIVKPLKAEAGSISGAETAGLGSLKCFSCAALAVPAKLTNTNVKAKSLVTKRSPL